MGSWAKETFDALTLEQKVGQIICYRASKWRSETVAMAAEGLVGFVSPGYYAGMRSLDDIVGFLNDLNAASPVPVMAISSSAHARPELGASPFPDPNSYMVLGAARSSDLAYRFARLAAKESKAMGYDMVWEPCVDVNTEPRNPIIGTRAFSDRPELVAEIAASVVKGMQDEGVIPNAKHFPGHGDTAFDTHVKIGTVDHSLQRLRAVEFYPYRELIRNAELKGIMTAHIIFPALEEDTSIPATFSRQAIHGVLREEMGFEGLIVSDSLTMKAIKDHYGVGEAAVRTFNAGHDIVLQDYNEPPRPTFDALLGAVRSGRIPESEINLSVMRILEAKEWSGLHERPALDVEKARQQFRQPEHLAVATEIFESSVTLLENRDRPLDRSGSFCLIATESPEEGRALTDMEQTVENSREVFFAEMSERLNGQVVTHTLPEDPSEEEVTAALDVAAEYDWVVFATMPRIVCYKTLSGSVGGGQIELVRRLEQKDKGVVLCVFGTPYVIDDFPELGLCLTTYSACPGAVRAGVKVLFGEIPARGRLPVTLSKRYPFGYGL